MRNKNKNDKKVINIIFKSQLPNIDPIEPISLLFTDAMNNKIKMALFDVRYKSHV